ncbi:MAG: alkaline phosphatase D family protein [Limisphaerales bacterium]
MNSAAGSPSARPSRATTPPLIVTRRKFLATASRGVAAGALASGLGFPSIARAAGPHQVFQHGVASGDPVPAGVTLWTRVTPTPEALPGSGLGPEVVVRWEVSRTPNFHAVVARGLVPTNAGRDHTVKVNVGGLFPPGASFYYRFTLGRNNHSPVGRTRTAPRYGAPLNSLRFGLVSCSNYQAGFFSAYRFLAERSDLDFILHVGDYIYEYPAGVYADPRVLPLRAHDAPGEMVSLAEYRRRHAQYKADPDLQAVHAAHPFICTWDDHELTNDAWSGGAENHQPDNEGRFITRQAAAYQAYFEWMPIRLPDPAGEPARIYRQFQFGTLADLSMLDLRQYRDAQPANGLDPAKDEAERVIMGREQLDWLKEELGASPTLWKLVGNSVMVTPVDFRSPLPPQLAGAAQALGLMMGVPFNVDSWDGYTDDRRELLEFLTTEGVDNVAFLTGDIHSSWACDVPPDFGAPSTAVEFVSTSITSDNLNEILGQAPRNQTSQLVETIFKVANPHVKLLEFDSHGYSVVDVTRERIQVDWFYISDRADAAATQAFAAAYRCVAGQNRVTPAAGPVVP